MMEYRHSNPFTAFPAELPPLSETIDGYQLLNDFLKPKMRGEAPLNTPVAVAVPVNIIDGYNVYDYHPSQFFDGVQLNGESDCAVRRYFFTHLRKREDQKLYKRKVEGYGHCRWAERAKTEIYDQNNKENGVIGKRKEYEFQIAKAKKYVIDIDGDFQVEWIMGEYFYLIEPEGVKPENKELVICEIIMKKRKRQNDHRVGGSTAVHQSAEVAKQESKGKRVIQETTDKPGSSSVVHQSGDDVAKQESKAKRVIQETTDKAGSSSVVHQSGDDVAKQKTKGQGQQNMSKEKGMSSSSKGLDEILDASEMFFNECRTISDVLIDDDYFPSDDEQVMQFRSDFDDSMDQV